MRLMPSRPETSLERKATLTLDNLQHRLHVTMTRVVIDIRGVFSKAKALEQPPVFIENEQESPGCPDIRPYRCWVTLPLLERLLSSEACPCVVSC